MTPETAEDKFLTDALEEASHIVQASALPTALEPQHIKLLYSVLSVIPDGIAITDRQGELLLANAAMQRLIGIDQQGITPEQWPETYGLFLPHTTRCFPASQFPLVRAIQGEESPDVEIYLRNTRVPEGRWINAVGRPLKNGEGLLWGGAVVFRDISEYRRLEQEILDTSGREQRRIGHDLHDGLCQILTGIKFMCSASLRRIQDKFSPEAGEWVEIQKLVSQALREADNVAKGLYPVELEVNGLVSALHELASQTQKLYRVACVFICENPPKILNQEVAIHIYRIVQEAITNAIKHGQAKNIMIWLTPAAEKLSMIVKNDGVVPSDAPLRQGMGWRIMNYRAEMIGATLRFEREPAAGCVLTCEFYDRPSKQQAFRSHDG